MKVRCLRLTKGAVSDRSMRILITNSALHRIIEVPISSEIRLHCVTSVMFFYLKDRKDNHWL